MKLASSQVHAQPSAMEWVLTRFGARSWENPVPALVTRVSNGSLSLILPNAHANNLQPGPNSTIFELHGVPVNDVTPCFVDDLPKFQTTLAGAIRGNRRQRATIYGFHGPAADAGLMMDISEETNMDEEDPTTQSGEEGDDESDDGKIGEGAVSRAGSEGNNNQDWNVNPARVPATPKQRRKARFKAESPEKDIGSIFHALSSPASAVSSVSKPPLSELAFGDGRVFGRLKRISLASGVYESAPLCGYRGHVHVAAESAPMPMDVSPRCLPHRISEVVLAIMGSFRQILKDVPVTQEELRAVIGNDCTDEEFFLVLHYLAEQDKLFLAGELVFVL